MWGVTKIIPFVKEDAAFSKVDLILRETMEAYVQLRAACPRGDLRIHLSVEGDRHAVGATDLKGSDGR